MILRPPTPADAEACGRICYEAFAGIAQQHGFPADFPSPEAATDIVGWMIGHPGFYGVVTEQDGRVTGSNFLDERNPVAGVGPITVDPAVQNAGTGRALMEDVLDRARQSGFAGVRLLQSAYHSRSLSLYAKLGHSVGESNEDLKALIGAATEFAGPGFIVPMRNGELFRWCLDRGQRVVFVMTLMSVGLYNEPAGAYLPSVLY